MMVYCIFVSVVHYRANGITNMQDFSGCRSNEKKKKTKTIHDALDDVTARSRVVKKIQRNYNEPYKTGTRTREEMF